MLSTHTSESGPDPKEVKQWIKTKLAVSLKALQKQFVTTDAVVTSDDSDANILCCALEAVFIHGIKNKYIKTETGGRGKKLGMRGPLPQPVFWSLLKTITHRDVVTELEHLNFINTDIGRCRAWIRLALNDGLMECYIITLLRERSKLSGYYQPAALLLDTEEREVLLSYLQGLTSLSFQLSYKSAVLNDWTVTPLVLAGLCPSSDSFDLPASDSKLNESWDSVSQSLGSDIIEVHHNSGSAQSKNVGKSKLTSSTLSLDTTGSSQLSSSLSSDSLLQVNESKSPDKSSDEPWSCDSDMGIMSAEDSGKSMRGVMNDFSESAQSSQDSEKEGLFLSNQEQELPSETAEACDDETRGQSTAPANIGNASTLVILQPEFESVRELEYDVEKPVPAPELPDHIPQLSVQLMDETSGISEPALVDEKHDICKTENRCQETGPNIQCCFEESLHSPTTGLPKSRSWISEDDIYKPYQDDKPREEQVQSDSTTTMNGVDFAGLELPHLRSPSSDGKLPLNHEFKVVHRRQIGLSNPFRGLLKLGNLERRGAVGIWKEYRCELSPYEFRLYQNDEERTCAENCSLLRCESVGSASSDGRFELLFSGKKLYLRAPSQDEAEDWLDRLQEALHKCRPPQQDDHWEILQAATSSNVISEEPPSPGQPNEAVEDKKPIALDWIRHTEPEQDAIKESVLYVFTDNKSWEPYVFSLSLEALKCFRISDQQKILHNSSKIEAIRDIVPDTSLGGPAFFKILTSKTTLKLQAENANEAKSWRVVIRGALTSYLETSEDPQTGVGGDGNFHRLIQYSIKGSSALLPYLTTVPTEKGLDAQNFKCAGCPRQIGFSFGKPKLCEFSGQYYCETCHQDDDTVIPSRIIHNWDLTKRLVSRQAMKLLSQIESEPLINMESVNASLYDHAEQLAHICKSRQKIKLLGDYLITCRSGAIKTMHTKLEKRNYLLESAHLYGVADLRQVAEGQYEAFLQSLIQFASNHVYQCDLCTMRGFICQICNGNDIIFPFEFDTTTRCKECKAVFHPSCKAQSKSCPCCLRRQRYLERELQD